MTLTTLAAETADEGDWEEFVFAHAAATFFHRFAWSRVLKQAFGHTPHYLVARRDGRVVGVLPLVEVNSRLFGHRLSSLPFAVYGGILADCAEVEDALSGAAMQLADHLNVGALELKSREPSSRDWPVKNLYFTFRKTLFDDHAANLKAIPNRQRAMLRKALKEGLFSLETEDVARVYRVYAESVRNLGTPVFAASYLRILKSEFGDACRMLIICQASGAEPTGGVDDKALCEGAPASNGGEDVAAVLSFSFRGEILPYYGGSVSRAKHIKGCNHFLYWELMRRSVDEGISGFDFGRSKADTGPFTFKKNFGFEASPLPYEYYLVNDAAPPDINPNNPRYRRLVAIWQKLPLPLANFIGPHIAKSLG